MGFWNGVQHVFTLGGKYRCDKAHDRFVKELSIYERLRGDIEFANQRIDYALGRLRARFAKTKSNLQLAHEILYPQCMQGEPNSLGMSEPQHDGQLFSSYSRRNLDDLPTVSAAKHALIGAGAGTSVAIAAWAGVQIAGIASTGTAIGGIYGAAASNAGWAAFGGGSLATGGGGMALGHLVLPGIGIAVGVAYMSVVSHTKANDLNRISDEMKVATEQNRSTLVKVDASSKRLVEAENKFNREDDRLDDAISAAQKRLFRFGWFSNAYKKLRFRLRGIYYTTDEQVTVSNLNEAVEHFMQVFGVAR